MDKQHDKRVRNLEERAKAEIHIDLLEITKKKKNWKTPSHDGIHGFWFNKFTPVHDRLPFKMKRCLQEAHVTEWMTKEKTTLIQNEPLKRTSEKNADI